MTRTLLAALALASLFSGHAWAFAVVGVHDVPSGLAWGAACGATVGVFLGLIFVSVRSRSETARGLCALGALVVLIFGVSPAFADPAGAGIRPDPILTPGAVRTTDKAEICRTKTSTVRNVSGSEKLAVYRRYGMAGPNAAFPGTELLPPYEIDHLISLELGGSNDITNLWPESYSQPMGAHQKDALENRLHHLVCAGRVTVEEAQRAIATDWVAAYAEYIGTPRGGQ